MDDNTTPPEGQLLAESAPEYDTTMVEKFEDSQGAQTEQTGIQEALSIPPMINPACTASPLKIIITALKPDHRGQPYSVSFEGETIISKSHVPSHDACRFLAEQGFTGPLEVWSGIEPFARLKIADLVKAAKWTVKEGDAHGPKFSPYVRFDRSAFMARLEVDREAA